MSILLHTTINAFCCIQQSVASAAHSNQWILHSYHQQLLMLLLLLLVYDILLKQIQPLFSQMDLALHNQHLVWLMFQSNASR